jgi:hypothetical protein
MATAVAVEWLASMLAAVITVNVAVVRSVKRRPCATCHRRRVVYTLSVTSIPFGNPDNDWRCLSCWGLRNRG